jgi:hypothetical protein
MFKYVKTTSAQRKYKQDFVGKFFMPLSRIFAENPYFD